jgi:hypothetical protein
LRVVVFDLALGQQRLGLVEAGLAVVVADLGNDVAGVRERALLTAGTAMTLPRVSARSSTSLLATVCPRSTISTMRGSAVCCCTRTRASGGAAGSAISAVAAAGFTGLSLMSWPERSHAVTAMVMPQAMM